MPEDNCINCRCLVFADFDAIERELAAELGIDLASPDLSSCYGRHPRMATIELVGFHRLDGERIEVSDPPPSVYKMSALDQGELHRMRKFDPHSPEAQEPVLAVRLIFKREKLRADGVWVYRFDSTATVGGVPRRRRDEDTYSDE